MAAEHQIAAPHDTAIHGSDVSRVASAPKDAHLGMVLAEQYRIDERLGAGGMGTVYLGTQLSIDRPVAIKMLASCVENSTEHCLRFRREAEALAKLRHLNTVRLLDFGISEHDAPFIVMELLSGVTLDQLIAERGSIGLEEALHITRQIAQSLSEAHALEIIHRDLKPGNVFICQVDGGDTFVKVMDFGVASLQRDNARSALTVRGAVLGTAAYMSPEQAQGNPVDARADLYSLGVVLFEMLAGSPPFQADSAISLLLAKVTTPPPRLAERRGKLPLGEEVQLLLDALLATDPKQRIASANEVIAIIDELLLALGKLAPRVPLLAADSARSYRRFHVHHPMFATGLLLGISLCLTGWSYANRSRPGSQMALLEDTWTETAAAALDRAHRARAVVQYWSGPHPSVVTIASTPSGATVSLAGAELGKTPYELRLTDDMLVDVSLAGYDPQQVSVTARGEPNLIVQLQPELPPP